MIYGYWLKTYDDFEYRAEDDAKPHQAVKGVGGLDALSVAIGKLAVDLGPDEVLEVVVEGMQENDD
jgi:hypothetical protein